MSSSARLQSGRHATAEGDGMAASRARHAAALRDPHLDRGVHISQTARIVHKRLIQAVRGCQTRCSMQPRMHEAALVVEVQEVPPQA